MNENLQPQLRSKQNSILDQIERNTLEQHKKSIVRVPIIHLFTISIVLQKNREKI
jgi:hypothetical protein